MKFDHKYDLQVDSRSNCNNTQNAERVLKHQMPVSTVDFQVAALQCRIGDMK